jgi:hypothetical protein
VEKVPRLSEEIRDRWIKNLKSSYLVKGNPDTPVVLESN